MSKPEIFLSFAWGGKGEKIANILGDVFQEKGVVMMHDRMDPGFNALISAFMQRMGEGKAIVVVISDEYLKSPYCMFELMEICQNPDFRKYIFPVVLDDAKIFEPIPRMMYINYWLDDKKKLKDGDENFGANISPLTSKELEIYQKLMDEFEELLNLLMEINALTPEMYRVGDLKTLVAAIQKCINIEPALIKGENLQPTELLVNKIDAVQEEISYNPKKALTHRYPGVKPFSESERQQFYGRGADSKKLFQLIELEKLVLLYGKSGLGKSSLLNAGVLPLFDEAHNNIVVKIRLGTHVETSLSPVAASLLKIPVKSTNALLNKLEAGAETFWLRIKNLQYKQIGATKTYILVFDQFEELFSYSPEEVKQFKRQVSDLLYAKVPGYINQAITNRLREEPSFLSDEELEYLYRPAAVKVILSIRSDRMSLLNTLTDYLPGILKNYYELKPLSRDDASDAIIKPAADEEENYLSKPFAYKHETIKHILDYLTQNGEKSIETFQLQTICQFTENLASEYLWRITQKVQKLEIKPEMLGDLKNVFRKHYDNLIGTIKPPERQLSARMLIENKLIIDGNRVSLPDVVVMKEKGIDKELIAYLHDTHHILRSEPNTTGGISYELSHDTLVAPILKAKKEREEKEELARFEAERQEELRKQKEKAEEEKLKLAITKKRLRVVYGLLGLAFLAMAAAILFLLKATSATELAKRATIEANESNHKLQEFLNIVIGAKYQGGRIAWKDSSGKHFLIAVEKDLGIFSWKEAVDTCDRLVLNGYRDWHLPNRDELNKLFVNKNVVGEFAVAVYWSSDHYPNGAWSQGFVSGLQGSSNDTIKYHVRPVRTF
ncbi:hypothetical protein BH11BAC3_BH11BAC3_07730 [soil metagenome]